MRDGYADLPIDLPCQRCIGCQRDKADAWGVRCYHESTLHTRNCFATFTYRDSCLPSGLVKADLQKLFKRMRKAGLIFRYFGVGELGERTRRPHYHVLFFGQDFRDGSEVVGYNQDDPYYYNQWLNGVWGKGHVTLAPAEPGSIFYTAGYMLKNADCPDAFQVMSRRPYIGYGWLDKYHDNIARLGHVVIEGRKHQVPRSYLARPEFALELDELRERRRAYARDISPEQRVERRTRARDIEANLHDRIRKQRGHL